MQLKLLKILCNSDYREVDLEYYYNLYDVGMHVGCRKWNGKSYDEYGNKKYHPDKGRIDRILAKTKTVPLYMDGIPYITYEQIIRFIFKAGTPLSEEFEDYLFSVFDSIKKYGLFFDEDYGADISLEACTIKEGEPKYE